MRILITVPSLAREFGGPTTKAIGLAAALRSLGHDVRIAGAGDQAGEGTIGLGRVASFHGTPIPRTIAPIRRAIEGAEIVHVLGFRDPVGTAAIRSATKRRIPAVLEPVGMLEPRLRSLALKRAFDTTVGRSLIHDASAVVVTSSVEKHDFLAAGIDAKWMVVRPNGVDFEALLPLPPRGQLRGRFGIPPDAPLVVTLARIGMIKGLTIMARALGSLDGAYWLLAGPDEDDGALQALRSELVRVRSSDRAVIVTDGLWGDEKRAALADADAFCLPSSYESFGNSAAEAAGVGLPVVITEGCGVKDVLVGPTCHVVPVGDHERLATALVEAIRPAARGAASEDASAVRDRLNWTTVAGAQLAINQRLLVER